MQRGNSDTWILAGLLAGTSAITLSMCWSGRATLLEGISFITGALCVWLTVRESVWNFPISLANVITFAFVFFRARLFADTGLQVVYFILTMHGWYSWLYGGKMRTRLTISRVSRTEAVLVAVCGLGMALGMALYLQHFNGAVPGWDATTTSPSLCAQYLLNRKCLENWYCWIAADLIYIPLYFCKELWLTSVLYCVFLCMATIGLLQWRATFAREQLREREPQPRLEVGVA